MRATLPTPSVQGLSLTRRPWTAANYQALRLCFYVMPESHADEPQTTDKGLKIPVPSREDFEGFVKKVVSPAGRKRPADSDQPHEQSER